MYLSYVVSPKTDSLESVDENIVNNPKKETKKKV
jgi:hypothetical protein